MEPIDLFDQNNIAEEIKTCSICLDNLVENTHTLEGCNHTFHSACLIKWLRTGSYGCPMCRGTQDKSYFKKPNILRMILNYSKRKEAPKKLVKMVDKYKKMRDKSKGIVKECSIFNKKYKDILKRRNELYKKKWRSTVVLRRVLRELESIPIGTIKFIKK